ncbi:hypothetical protein ES705_46127 [subsurface metagenome]
MIRAFYDEKKHLSLIEAELVSMLKNMKHDLHENVSALLAEFQYKKGIRSYIKYIKQANTYKTNEIEYRSLLKSPFRNISKIEFLKDLTYLLKYVYKPSFNDHPYLSIKTDIFIGCQNIAMGSTKNFKKVRKALKKIEYLDPSLINYHLLEIEKKFLILNANYQSIDDSINFSRKYFYNLC